jgi:formylglycine-generating enzyme required for sulfatase activity
VRSVLLRFCLLVILLASPAAALDSIVWVPIGDPGNAADSQPAGLFGAVAYAYSISKFETTNAEYALFLNAKAASDPLGLYSLSMDSDTNGGITRTGTSGNYTYTVKAGVADEAVNFVTFYDSLRFANWVNNGEGNGDTETGAYTLLGGTEEPSNGPTVVRNLGAAVVVPTQNEWFKAAYYDAPIATYYDFPMGTDTTPTCTSPKATPNTANCDSNGITEVGAYTGSPSPYGTFDQGGNVREWNQNTAFGGVGRRAIRGGDWTGLTQPLKASSAGSFPATTGTEALGFRLVLLDDPGGGAMDVTEIGVSKLVERFDGTLASNPYAFEACVAGAGITSAQVTPPGAAPLPLWSISDDEYCLFRFFGDSAALDSAFPNGMYAFDIFGSGAADSKTLDLQATEPGAYLEIINPLEFAEVPDDQDLNFRWTLVEKSNGVGCVAGMSCADAIVAEIDEFSQADFMTIINEELPITATGILIPASDLTADNFYISMVGTRSGTPNFSDTTDMGDPTVTLSVYEDINSLEFEAVPEPAAGLLGIAALLTVAVVSRGRVGKI